MASEYVMYLAILTMGMLAVAGVAYSFNVMTDSTLQRTIESELSGITSSLSNKILQVMEQLETKSRLNDNLQLTVILDLPLTVGDQSYFIRIINTTYNDAIYYAINATTTGKFHVILIKILPLKVSDNLLLSGLFYGYASTKVISGNYFSNETISIKISGR